MVAYFLFFMCYYRNKPIRVAIKVRIATAIEMFSLISLLLSFFLISIILHYSNYCLNVVKGYSFIDINIIFAVNVVC